MDNRNQFLGLGLGLGLVIGLFIGLALDQIALGIPGPGWASCWHRRWIASANP
jgi:hypothetical protein